MEEVERLTAEEEETYILIALRRMEQDFRLELELYDKIKVNFNAKYHKFLKNRLAEVSSLIHKRESQRSLRTEFKITLPQVNDCTRNY